MDNAIQTNTNKRASELTPPVRLEEKLVTGVFHDRLSAERAFNTVTDRGYKASDVNVLMLDSTRKQHFAATDVQTNLGTRAGEGASVGVVIGGVISAAAAAFAAIGASIIIPGLGLIVAGPLATALAGVGAGGLAGGLVGALVGWGLPDEHLKHYQDAIDSGGILMGVKPRNTVDALYFEKEWRDARGAHVYR